MKKDQFKELVSEVLTSTTVEAYSHAYNTLKTFIDNNKLETLQKWLAWQNDKKSLIFRAFTNIYAPLSNFSEVKHAGWKNMDPSGISLFEAALLDVSLLTNTPFGELRSGTYDGGYGPSIPKMNIHAEQSKKQLGSRIGSDLMDFNIDREAISTKTFIVGEESDCNLPKRKNNNIKLFENRYKISKQLNDLMKICSVKKINIANHTFAITSSINRRCPCNLSICNTPSCSCPDFKK